MWRGGGGAHKLKSSLKTYGWIDSSGLCKPCPLTLEYERTGIIRFAFARPFHSNSAAGKRFPREMRGCSVSEGMVLSSSSTTHDPILASLINACSSGDSVLQRRGHEITATGNMETWAMETGNFETGGI